MTTTNSVLDALETELSPGRIEKISTQLDTDTAATSRAISMAVPILLGRLSKNASDAEGSAALDSALAAHDGHILDNIATLLGGGAGAAILKHILGRRQAPVEEGVGRATGLDAKKVGELLVMLAPIVMGVLGRMKRQHNVTAEQLPVVLGQANLDMTRQSTAVGDLSRVLDSDDDGGIADEVARIGSSILGGMLGQGATA